MGGLSILLYLVAMEVGFKSTTNHGKFVEVLIYPNYRVSGDEIEDRSNPNWRYEVLDSGQINNPSPIQGF